MATTVNSGTNFTIYNVVLTAASDTAFAITSGYTPATTSDTPSGFTPIQVMNANTVLIKCRTAVDLQLRKTLAAADYFTIPSGTTFELKVNPSQVGSAVPFFTLKSTSGSVIAEIIVYNG